MAATLLVYWPALRNGFVWDDTALVLRDPLIRSWRLIAEGFRHFLFLDATASNFYRPIQRLSFVFDYRVYGFDQPWGWHLTSILVHAGAAVALFFAALNLLAAMAVDLAEKTRFGIALGVALLWAIHPLQTSAVTYVAGRADPLAALFGFTGLALGFVALRGRKLWNLGAAFCFFLAMLSKESGMIFLPIWLLVLVWRHETRRALISWLVIAVITFAAYAALRYSSDKVPPPAPPPTPLAIQPILAVRAFAGYAALVAAPVTLRMERDITTHPLDTSADTFQEAHRLEFQSLAGVLLLIGFIHWMRSCWRREPAAALCLAAFVLAYLPISNLLPLNATIAEHWLYVPGAFLFLAAALSLRRLMAPRGAAAIRAVIAIGLCWFVALGVRTWLRQLDWRDQRTFIERTISAGGNSPRMLMNLGNLEFAAGHQDAALGLYIEALRRAPDQAVIWLAYATVLVRAHDFSGAQAALSHAEKSPMLAADCLTLKASLELAQSGRDPGDLLRQAVAAAPANWGIRKRYLQYVTEKSGPQEAARELTGFLERYPFRAESWRLLATLLEAQHQPALAAKAWQEAAGRDIRDEESRAALQRLAEAPRQSALAN